MNVCHNILLGAKLYPDRQAILFEQQALTYLDVERLSAQAAAVLRQSGMQRGDRVGIVLPNSPAFVVWYYAVLRLGGVAVTISTRLAAEEVAYMLTDCGAKILVATQQQAGPMETELPDEVQQLLTVSEDGLRCLDAPLADHDPAAPRECVNTESDEPAVILYTSGTTGFPKGATLSHQNIRATVHAFNHLCQMQLHDRLLLAVPLFHCYGQNALLNAGLNVGLTLIVQRRFDLNESKRLIKEHLVTKLFGVPTTFQLLLECCEPQELESIGYCFSAAATLPLQLSQRWRDRFGMPIYEGYGLTETAPFASYNHRVQYMPGSIGTPVDLVEMKIVDPETGEDCPPDTPGEIAIRGPNVMLGYWNRPQETAAAIRDGWFYSGDMGQIDERGFFYIVDRLKDMISIGGMKVFPAEVERVLLDHPNVAEVAVVGLPDDVLGEKVAAFVVCRQPDPSSADSIHKHAQQHLGSFKSPKRIELVDELPRNAAGKVLKTRLREQWSGEQVKSGRASLALPAAKPQASGRHPQQGDAAAAPPSPLLSKLASTHPASRLRMLTAWIQDETRQVMDVEQPPAPDDLLIDAGLDSLMMVELRDRLQQHVGPRLELPATMFFDHPRIGDLAQHLLQALAPAPAGPSSSASGKTDNGMSSHAATLVEQVEGMSEQEALRELIRELDN